MSEHGVWSARRLAPGVYFVRMASSVGREAPAVSRELSALIVRKVVITR